MVTGDYEYNPRRKPSLSEMAEAARENAVQGIDSALLMGGMYVSNPRELAEIFVDSVLAVVAARYPPPKLETKGERLPLSELEWFREGTSDVYSGADLQQFEFNGRSVKFMDELDPRGELRASFKDQTFVVWEADI